MRLHRLTVRAFGPFPGVEQVDFDELSSAGLFLLTGPTGAGKTTILDAICFALYGSVPGVRGVKALKSQHAAPDAQPEVVLDFSVRDRRFVIRRSPEWTRPKRRGDGTITEKASATLTETTGGVDHFLSSRAQEVGHTVSELIGMQSTQFVQVAMLPQGEFQRFLRASSQDRHDVLQHLFRSERFSRIEDWVHDHSRGLREKSADAELAVQRILDTAADHCSVELPEGVLAGAAEWMHGRVTVARAQRAEASACHAEATERAALARDHHGETRRLLALTAKRDQASAALATLAAREDDVDAARRRLELDQRAARCLPLVRMLDETDVALSRTRCERDQALRSA
ncbi:MAG: AAA family ATPase, partial [Nocardioidaceae bacterium]